MVLLQPLRYASLPHLLGRRLFLPGGSRRYVPLRRVGERLPRLLRRLLLSGSVSGFPLRRLQSALSLQPLRERRGLLRTLSPCGLGSLSLLRLSSSRVCRLNERTLIQEGY